MSKSVIHNTKIKGISAVVPPKEISIYDEAQYYGNNLKKIDRMRKMVGFFKRRVVEDGVTASDLSIQAAERLIKDLNIDTSTIDALIFVVQRPDVLRPATAFYIHKKLKLKKTCPAFDINQGCQGWLYGMWVAHSLISSGAAKKVLLLAGDTPSADIALDDRISAPVFGDAGTATLLEFDESATPSFFDVGADGNGFETIAMPASAYRMGPRLSTKYADFDNSDILEDITTPAGNTVRLTDGYMDGISVFNFTITEVPVSIKSLMEYAKVQEKDIPVLMLHQANKQIVQTVAQAAGFPLEKAPYESFELYGNQSIVSIPVSINHIFSKNENFKTKNILCSGFGNGLAWVSALFDFTGTHISGIQDYVKPADFKTREELVKYWKNKIKNTGR